jgi:hypothetical protein
MKRSFVKRQAGRLIQRGNGRVGITAGVSSGDGKSAGQ